VEGERHYNGGVPALNGVAVVHEGFIAKGRNRETLLLETGEDPGNEELKEEISRVNLPGIEVRAGILSTALSNDPANWFKDYSPSPHAPTFSTRKGQCHLPSRDRPVFHRRTTSKSTSNTSKWGTQ
jgi:hypothetical protein